MSQTQIPNRELLSRLVDAGPDDPAWLEFISRFQGRIRMFAYRAYATEVERRPGLHSPLSDEALEDLTQEVFVRLIDGGRRALTQFRGTNENSIYMYLCTIATNLVRDHFKKLRAQRRPSVVASLSEPVRTADGPLESLTRVDLVTSSEPGPERVAESAELRSQISRAIDKTSRGSLIKRDRQIFQLYFIEGNTLEEIASIRAVGLSVSGVEKRVRKMKEAVQKIVGREEKREEKAGKNRPREREREKCLESLQALAAQA